MLLGSLRHRIYIPDIRKCYWEFTSLKLYIKYLKNCNNVVRLGMILYGIPSLSFSICIRKRLFLSVYLGAEN